MSEAGEQKVILSPLLQKYTGAISLVFAMFAIVTAFTGPFPTIIQRAIFLGFSMLMVFHLHPRGPAWWWKGLDWILTLVGAVACVYVIWHFDAIIDMRLPFTLFNLTLGTIFTLVVLEASWRVLGWSLPAMAGLAVAYAVWGHLIPGAWGIHKIPYKVIIEQLYLGDWGFFGPVTGSVATMVATFMVFGQLLMATGGGEVFMKLATGIAKHTRGGAAQVATVASSAFGSISGSAVANVCTTGIVTIPMMRRAGYPASFAAATEAVASTGGQLMPPIMGIGAFIMTEFLGVSYTTVALAAVIPALLYYLGLGLTVEFEARRMQIPRMTAEMVGEGVWKVISRWQQSGPVLLSLILLVVMMYRGYTPERACFYAIVICLLFYLLPVLRDMKELQIRMKNVLESLMAGGKSLVMVAAMIACAEIVISLVQYSGIATKVTSVMFALGQEQLLVSLFLTMIITTILGLGLPTTPSYILAASLLAPTLIHLGVPPIAAHMFIFYYGVLSDLTPPFCASVFIAAGMAGADWVRTAMRALQLGLVAFIIPFMFVYSPALLLQGSVTDIILNSVTALLGVVALSAATAGYMVRPLSLWQRILAGAGGLLMIVPGLTTDLVGLGMLALGLASQWNGLFGRQQETAIDSAASVEVSGNRGK